MIDHDTFKDVDREKHSLNFAYTVANLATVGRLALECGRGGVTDEVRASAVADLFQLMEAMMGVVIEGVEEHERARGMGFWARKEATA